jgi:hypothetical protein
MIDVQASIDAIHWIFGEEIFRPFSGPEYLFWLGAQAGESVNRPTPTTEATSVL